MPLSRVGLYERFAVASEHPLASIAGYDILRNGGNAIDAACSISLSLCVLQPHLCGLGGDFFALYYCKDDGRVYCINSSGWYPYRIDKDSFEIPTYGPYSSTVPGLIAGVSELHERFGTMNFSDLLQRPIEYAENGFPVMYSLSRSLSSTLPYLSKDAKSVFSVGGRPIKVGELLRQRNLARALKEIADHGAEAFYKGTIADCICKELQSLNSPISEDDFRVFQPEWVEPVLFDYRGFNIYEIPPNSMGITTLLILQYFKEIGMNKVMPDSADRLRLATEIAKISYTKRDLLLGDPRFNRIDLKEFLSVNNVNINMIRQNLMNGDTTSFAVIDSGGNIVSAIQSLFHHFGSRVYINEYGIFLNNRASAFSKSGPNRPERRKRPLHTLSSLLVGRDEPEIALGCSGGEFRPQQHAFFISNLIDYGMSLEDSLDYPRFLWGGADSLIVEGDHYPLSNLTNFNYIINKDRYPGSTGVAHAIQTIGGVKKAVCDVRGDGLPIGI